MEKSGCCPTFVCQIRLLRPPCWNQLSTWHAGKPGHYTNLRRRERWVQRSCLNGVNQGQALLCKCANSLGNICQGDSVWIHDAAAWVRPLVLPDQCYPSHRIAAFHHYLHPVTWNAGALTGLWGTKKYALLLKSFGKNSSHMGIINQNPMGC